MARPLGSPSAWRPGESFYKNNTPIPTHSLIGLLRLILQTHGTAIMTEVAVSFANIFMSAVETEILNKSKIIPLEWKRYIDDVFSLWDTKRKEIDQFILEANRHHPTIKFMAEISDKETNFLLDTTIFKGERFHEDSIFDINLYLNPTEQFNKCTTLAVLLEVRNKGYIKGDLALKLLRTNSSEARFEDTFACPRLSRQSN